MATQEVGRQVCVACAKLVEEQGPLGSQNQETLSEHVNEEKIRPTEGDNGKRSMLALAPRWGGEYTSSENLEAPPARFGIQTHTMITDWTRDCFKSLPGWR